MTRGRCHILSLPRFWIFDQQVPSVQKPPLSTFIGALLDFCFCQFPLELYTVRGTSKHHLLSYHTSTIGLHLCSDLTRVASPLFHYQSCLPSHPPTAVCRQAYHQIAMYRQAHTRRRTSHERHYTNPPFTIPAMAKQVILTPHLSRPSHTLRADRSR